MAKYVYRGPEAYAPTLGLLLRDGDVVDLDELPNNPAFAPVPAAKGAKEAPPAAPATQDGKGDA
ncbi:MAG: hypothetical protein QJR03_12185 [Sphaerobacter sp.]|nr:hypothetical protein [Sphaerobacter sp.]